MRHLIIASLLALSAAPAVASDFAVGAQVGTLGYGLQLSKAVTSHLDLRTDVNYFNYTYEETTTDASYQAHLTLNTVGLLGDYYPFGSGLRITTGLRYNLNGADLSATPAAGSYTFNGNTYAASDVGTVNGDIRFNKVAPYLGIGFGKAIDRTSGLRIVSDLGVMYQGKAKVNLTATGAASDPAFAQDIEAERAKLENDLGKYRFYPVASIALQYVF